MDFFLASRTDSLVLVQIRDDEGLCKSWRDLRNTEELNWWHSVS